MPLLDAVVDHLASVLNPMQIMMLTEKKTELERRLQHLLSEREGLTSNLDESSDRIMGLERQCHEQEIHLRETHRELNELRAANGSLCERIESLTRTLSSPSAPSYHHSHSLLAEMDLSAASSGHGSASSPNSHPSLTGQDDIEIDDIECDDPQAESSLVVEEQNQKVGFFLAFSFCFIVHLLVIKRERNMELVSGYPLTTINNIRTGKRVFFSLVYFTSLLRQNML